MIRRAIRGDEDLLAGIIRESFRDVAQRFGLTRANCPSHASHCMPSWIAGEMARGVGYFILAVADRPVGCVAVESPNPEVCYLERLAVLPAMRVTGCGALLVEHVLAVAAGQGAGKVSIGVIAAQTGLKDWYRRFGFVEVATRRFAQLPFEVCFMECAIAGARAHRQGGGPGPVV